MFEASRQQYFSSLMTFYQPGFEFSERVIIAVDRVFSIARFVVVSLRARVLAPFGPVAVIITDLVHNV